MPWEMNRIEQAMENTTTCDFFFKNVEDNFLPNIKIKNFTTWVNKQTGTTGYQVIGGWLSNLLLECVKGCDTSIPHIINKFELYNLNK